MMKRRVSPLALLLGGALAALVLIPLLSLFFVVALVGLGLLLTALFALPLLMRWPWFRKRFMPGQGQGWRAVRYGKGVVFTYDGRQPNEQDEERTQRLQDGTVIDVEVPERRDRQEWEGPKEG